MINTIEHITRFKNQNNAEENKKLEKELSQIDFDLITNLYKNRHNITENNSTITPIKSHVLNKTEQDKYFNQGLEMIKNNKVAVVLMAGGQGTRLGHEGPKGTYNINLPSQKSLFHYQCDKLISLYGLTGQYITWYIMTSADNNDETIQHFEENNYFGYAKDQIVFFQQDRLPLILDNGEIALKNSHSINLAANGNGGVFSSLHSNKILKKMRMDGNEYVFLYGVDNVLAKLADPTFLAFTHEQGCEISSKAVDKVSPEEKVGVMCYKDGKPSIVEYSELSDEMRYLKNQNGDLVYKDANILAHLFKLDFLEKCATLDLPYHLAHKKVNYYDGGYQLADQPNGYKFELFMFDVFQYANDMTVLTVDRSEEFAPVKNKEGKDSPETARELLINLHKKWLSNINYKLDIHEIDSSITYQGENLENYKKG